jgi:hypothetical protein
MRNPLAGAERIETRWRAPAGLQCMGILQSKIPAQNAAENKGSLIRRSYPPLSGHSFLPGPNFLFQALCCFIFRFSCTYI